MSGLIMKELLFIKTNFNARFLLFFIVYIVITINLGIDATFILPIMALMIIMSSFSYDEFNNWNAYTATLPNGRRNAVLAKYISSLIVTFAISVLSIIIQLAAGLITGEIIDLTDIFSSLAVTMLVVIIMISFTYPMMFKFGATNGRIWMFILFFFIAGIGGFAANYIDKTFLLTILQAVEDYIFIALPVMSVILLLASYLISLMIYKNKEF